MASRAALPSDISTHLLKPARSPLLTIDVRARYMASPSFAIWTHELRAFFITWPSVVMRFITALPLRRCFPSELQN